MAPTMAASGRRQASARRGGGRSEDRGRAGARGRGCRWRRRLAAPSPASCIALRCSTLSERSAALVPGVRTGVRKAPTDCHRPPRMLCVTITELPDCCRKTVPSPQFPQTVIPTLPPLPPGCVQGPWMHSVGSAAKGSIAFLCPLGSAHGAVRAGSLNGGRWLRFPLSGYFSGCVFG